MSFGKNSTGALEIVDANDYYPFGMNHLKTGNAFFGQESFKNYKYNGKELQETGMYDYGARMYMPDAPHWGTVDPLAEKMPWISPYAFGYNNPIKYNDPTGMEPEPFCPKCPASTYIPLAKGAYDLNVGEKTSNGWSAIRVDQDQQSGYRAVLFQGTFKGKTEYIYATAGSDDFGDWINNAQQLSAKSEQYRMSVNKAIVLERNYEGISFTGHSLGGGLASANALAAGGKAVTFNAAGLSNATKQELSLNKKANITALIVKGEILDWSQRTTPGLHRAEGNKIEMPPAYSNWNNVNRARNHMIGAVETSFQKYKEQLVNNIKIENNGYKI